MLFERKFSLLRFYPKRSTYEFINVGVLLKEGEKIQVRMLEDFHAKSLEKCILLSNSVFKSAFKTFHENILESFSKGGIERFLAKNYKNLFDQSEWFSVRDEGEFQEHLEFLYQEYIGYKFQPARKDFQSKIEEPK